MASLQEQFLKAGLVDKNKVKQAHQEKTKQKKVERRSGCHFQKTTARNVRSR